MGQKIKVDLTGVETFQRASEGLHTCKVATAEVKQSQGGNDMIVVAFEVTKGVDKGARVYENYPLVDTALWKLKGLLQAVGMKADGKVQLDLDKLVGKILTVNVKHEEYEGKLRARVESVSKFSAAEDSDETSDDDWDEEDSDDEEEEKPKKKAAPKKATKKSEPEEDEDDDDWDEEDEEDEEPAKKPEKKIAKKPEAKKPTKAAKKEEPEDSDDDDDDWDDDDWDE